MREPLCAVPLAPYYGIPGAIDEKHAGHGQKRNQHKTGGVICIAVSNMRAPCATQLAKRIRAALQHFLPRGYRHTSIAALPCPRSCPLQLLRRDLFGANMRSDGEGATSRGGILSGIGGARLAPKGSPAPAFWLQRTCGIRARPYKARRAQIGAGKTGRQLASQPGPRSRTIGVAVASFPSTFLFPTREVRTRGPQPARWACDGGLSQPGTVESEQYRETSSE